MPSQNLHTVLDGMPGVGQVALFVVLALGLVLWLMGRRLAKPVCILTSGSLGAAMGFVLVQAAGMSGLAIAAMIVGGIVGMVLGWWFFRLFMALSLAVVLAATLPVAALMLRGTAPPAVETQQVKDQFVDLTKPPRTDTEQSLHDRLAGIYKQQADEVRAWWDGLETGGRRLVVTSAGLGGVVGFVVGLFAPLTAAALESSLLGAAAMVLAGWQLLRLYSPDTADHLPHGPRVAALTLSLITLLGVLLQWTLSRRKADK